MSIRCWLYALALGGCLISGTLCAQENDPSASPSPQVDEQPIGKADDHQAPDEPLALPIRIIQSEEEAAHERERNAHELDAQVRSANAAERSAASAEWQEIPTLFQAIFAFIGTLGLIAALGLTYCANKSALRAAEAAESAVAVTQDTAKKQLRAYMLPSTVDFIDDHEDNLHIRVTFKNTGQTPARNCRSMVYAAIASPTETNFRFPDNTSKRSGDAGAGQTISGNFREVEGNSFVEEGANIMAKKRVLYVYGSLNYEDIFQAPQSITFRYRYSPDHDMFVDCDHGFSAT
jgi:hypothetical protein